MIERWERDAKTTLPEKKRKVPETKAFKKAKKSEEESKKLRTVTVCEKGKAKEERQLKTESSK